MGAGIEVPGHDAVLVGGAGFVGSATAVGLRERGCDVTVIDVNRPPDRVLEAGARWQRCDLLLDDLCLPDGDVVLLVGNGDPRTRWSWHQPLQTVITTGRLLEELRGRRVTLCSTLEAFGAAQPPLTDRSEPSLPWNDEKLQLWIDAARPLFERACPPWQAAGWCRQLVDADPTGRWVYGMAKRAQELLVLEAAPDATILRLANTVGPGQERVVARFARRAAAGRPLQVSDPVRRSFLPVGHIAEVIDGRPGPGVFIVGAPSIDLRSVAEHVVDAIDIGDERAPSEIHVVAVTTTDSCGEVGTTALDRLGLGVAPTASWLDDQIPRLLHDDGVGVHPPIGVVVPPRTARPDIVVERQQAALWSGAVKHGNRWSDELEARLHDELSLTDDHLILATTSGTDALRIMCGALSGPASPGQVAALPSFTFPATAEVVAQLGYRIRFVDVDPCTWTMDPESLRVALAPGDVTVAIAVDTFGHPADQPALQAVCDDAGVTLVMDSAAALGSMIDGRPVGSQALGHAFSMSFAKVLSAGGAGGAVVLPIGVELDGPYGWTRSALMNELHAIVALDQLEQLTEMVDRRNRAAELYIDAAGRLGLDHQHVAAGTRHSWVHFVLRIPGGPSVRDQVGRELAALGVGTKAYFLPLHSTGGAFGSVRVDGPTLEVTDTLGVECLALPMSSELNDEAIDRVCVALEHVLDPVQA